MHGVQQLGELEEALPGLAGVVGCFSHRTPELFNVINPHLLERRLVLQTLFGNWESDKSLRHWYGCNDCTTIIWNDLNFNDPILAMRTKQCRLLYLNLLAVLTWLQGTLYWTAKPAIPLDIYRKKYSPNVSLLCSIWATLRAAECFSDN